MSRSQDWTTRCMHEMRYHSTACFLTLTYNDANLPDNYSINREHLTLFLKRVRKRMGAFRFFGCGEYGDINLRPHYHLLMFGHDFAEDRTLWRQTKTGYLTYRSPRLESLWTMGHSEIGSVTSESAGYVARYCIKKVNGEAAADHYTRMHPITGEVCTVSPEFLAFSNKPGLGRKWVEEFKGDIYPSDFIILDGKKRPVPRYYKKQLTEKEELRVSANRKRAALAHRHNNTDERLDTREQVMQERLDRLKRESDQ